MRFAVSGLFTGFAAAALLATVAMAGPIDERQQAMKNIGQAMGALAAIAKKEAPFSADVVKASGTTIAENLTNASHLFPEGSAQGDAETWARADIWASPDDFKAKLDNGVEAATAMAAVTSEADFGAALGNLGGACKACHDSYRRPKD